MAPGLLCPLRPDVTRRSGDNCAQFSTPKTMKEITVQTRDGQPRAVPAVWQGQFLAVHRPLSSSTPGGLSDAPRHWSISHHHIGLGAAVGIDVAQRDAIALARLWDSAFAEITAEGARQWPLAQRWVDDVRRAEAGRAIIGPRELTPLEALESAGTYAEVSAAVARAMGHTFASDSEAAEQFPARDVVAADRLRDGADGLEMLWRGQWWQVPTFGDVEAWALDSCAETPDGRTVETDHPEAWTRLLGVV